MNITRDELREIVLEYKEQGLTFEKMSEKLEEQHGIRRDRQSLHGIYKRYMDKLERDKEKSRADVDIINVIARVDVFSTSKKLICEMNESVTDRYIKETIKKYSSDIKSVREEMKDIISDGIRTGSTKEEILESISYKSVTANESIYLKLATMAFKERIISSIEIIVAHSIEHNGNTAVAKELIKEFPTGKSVTVIKNKYL